MALPNLNPERFKDRYLRDELAKLSRSISDCDERIESLSRIVENLRSQIAREERQAAMESRRVIALNRSCGLEGGFRYPGEKNYHAENAAETTNRMYDWQIKRDEVKKQKRELETQKLELESLLRLPEGERSAARFRPPFPLAGN